MRQLSVFRVFAVLSITALSGSAIFAQGSGTAPAANPPAQSASAPAANTPAATTQAPSAPAASAPAGSSNSSVMLLQQGHSDSIRAKAADDLAKQGDLSTIPALAGALNDPSSKVRRAVVLALAEFHQPAALPGIERATRDTDDGVRITAIQCLVGYYTGVLPGSGFTGFMKKNWQRAAGHFQQDDTKIDPGINVDPGVIATLIASMKDTRSNDASRQAAKSLGILMAEPAVPELVAAAHSSDPDLSLEALNALAKIKDRNAGPQLVDLMDTPNYDVRRAACVTLGILRASAALPKMQAIYQGGPDQKDKVAAIQGLAYLGEKASVPLFTQALSSDNKDIRIAAGEGLARAADPQSVSELQKAIAVEKDASASLAMNFALAALGNAEAFNDLVSELSSKVRGDVARAYLVELSRNPAVLAKLYPYLLSPDSSIRAGLCRVLMFSGDESSLQQLDRLQHDPDGKVAAAALRAKQAIRARLGAAPTVAKT